MKKKYIYIKWSRDLDSKNFIIGKWSGFGAFSKFDDLRDLTKKLCRKHEDESFREIPYSQWDSTKFHVCKKCGWMHVCNFCCMIELWFCLGWTKFDASQTLWIKVWWSLVSRICHQTFGLKFEVYWLGFGLCFSSTLLKNPSSYTSNLRLKFWWWVLETPSHPFFIEGLKSHVFGPP